MRALTLLTPEYPPQPGGVSDYVQRLVAALRDAKLDVTLIAPESGLRVPQDGVQLETLPKGFGLPALSRLKQLIAHCNDRDEPLLVQYVPHGYGLRGMNLPLALLLRLRVRKLWVMFHEVSFTLEDAQGPAQTLLARVQLAMARLLLRRAERVFVSTSAWTPRLQKLGLVARAEELPIFSNLPQLKAEEVARHVRFQLTDGERRIAHFGTYGEAIRNMLLAVLPKLLAVAPQRTALLMGRGSARFAELLLKANPNLASQLHVLDDARPEEIAAGLAEATVVLQPFSDGATTRRTSLMAPLAQGAATVTTTGFLTEPIWAESNALRLCAADAPEALIAAVEDLLANPAECKALGARAAAFYAQHFSAERSVAILRAGA